MDLSKGHLMDGQHVLSQEHMAVAQEIAHRYENLRLVFIPPSDRIPGADREPFGIRDIRTGIMIKTVDEKMVPVLPRWLWENDSNRIDTYAAFMKKQEAEKKAREDAIDEKHAPKIDLAAHIIGSKLHTYVHDGVRYSDSGIERIK